MARLPLLYLCNWSWLTWKLMAKNNWIVTCPPCSWLGWQMPTSSTRSGSDSKWVAHSFAHLSFALQESRALLMRFKLKIPIPVINQGCQCSSRNWPLKPGAGGWAVELGNPEVMIRYAQKVISLPINIGRKDDVVISIGFNRKIRTELGKAGSGQRGVLSKDHWLGLEPNPVWVSQTAQNYGWHFFRAKAAGVIKLCRFIYKAFLRFLDFWWFQHGDHFH